VRGLPCLLLVAACAKPTPQLAKPARVTLTASEWVARCGDRIELARLQLARLERAFDNAKLEVDARPWHPTLHFEARTGENGLWWANVERGQHPCDEERLRGFVEWRDGTESDTRWMVDRYMRIGGDVAWVQADHVPQNTAIAFRREFQFALRECLLDAQGVALATPPPDLCRESDVPDVPDEPQVDESVLPSQP